MADDVPDAERDEFAALRARAYGPSPDLDDAERARLQEWEDRARATRAGLADAPGGGSNGGPDAGAAGRAPERRPRSPIHTWSVAAVAVTAVLLAGVHLEAGAAPEADGSSTASPVAAIDATDVRGAPGTRTLLEIPLGAAFGRDVDLPDRRMPEFPTDGVRWARSMGEYYGWRIWIGRGVTDDACVVAQRGGTTRARCVAEDEHRRGELLLALSRDEIPADERPEGLAGDQAVVFWWNPEGDLTVRRADVSAVLDR